MLATSPSLLDRLHQPSDGEAWRRLVDLYSPLNRAWLRKHGVGPAEAEDVVQEVLAVVVRRFPEFQHNQRTGAFRAWLRSIAINCSRDYWRSRQHRPDAPGGDDFGSYLDQLADPDNPLVAEWDREHDLFVTRRLLEQIRMQFEETTWEAFHRVAILGQSPAQVATALSITVNAVFIAKSRVLSRLRLEAAGLLDS